MVCSHLYEMYYHLPYFLNQPNPHGPTCLHTVYKFYQDFITLEEVISGVETLEDGGTLAVFLGSHALQRGYRATIIGYDLHFRSTWFSTDPVVDLGRNSNYRRDINTIRNFRLSPMLTCTL